MAGFKKRRAWTSQPQEVVEVDWNNPLLDGAEFVRLGSQIFWNPTNKSLTTVGALESRVTRQGLGQLLSSTQYQSYPAAVANGGTGPWTLAGLFMPVSGALPSQAVVGMAEAPNSSTFDRSIRLAAGTFEWQGYLYDGAAKNASTGVIPADGRVDLIITTTDTSTLVCSANGTEASIAVSSGGYAGYSSAEICIGRANNTWGGTFIVPLLVRTARYWSPAMRQSFWVNPWQLFAPRSKLIGGAAGGGTPTLTVPDTSHAHTLDNVVLTSSTTLAVQDMAHGHALDAPTLSTGTALTVADAQHAHTLDTPTLSTGTALTVADAQHAHTLDNVTLSTTGATSLTVADSLHAHTLDNVGLTSQAYLAVADMLHAHALDNAVLTLGGINLAVFDLAHTHALDNTALTLDTYLAVADLLHTHTFDNVVLSIPAVFTYAANASLYLGIGSDLSILLGGPRMPFWTTAGRPAAPLDGIYGLNKDTNAIEVWDGANWV